MKLILSLIDIAYILLIENVSVGIFNSIEWSKSDNKLWLHMFTIGDFQFSVEWSDLNKDDKSEIYVILRSILYN